MGTFIKVMSTSELSDGEMKTIVAGGVRLMIAHVGGEFFAIDDACTHAGCSLGSQGKLTGSTVTCGCHGGQFDVMTGAVVSPPPSKSAASYRVKVEGNDVLVSV